MSAAVAPTVRTSCCSGNDRKLDAAGDEASSSSRSGWVEFSSTLCRDLNEGRTCTLVCDGAAAERFIPLVDPIVGSHSFSSSLPKILFSTDDNRVKFSSCLAIYGREPLFAVTDCDNDRSFALNLRSQTSAEEIRSFLDRVARGTEPPAKKGAAPLPDDAFDDGFDIDLAYVKCAVQSTYQRLTGRELRSVVDYRCIGILFSDRCPCCPPLLRTMDYLFSLLESNANQEDNVTRVLCACNVDENELGPEDWPEDPSEQVVPMLNAYANGKPTRFSGPKSGAALIDFTCRAYFGPAESAVQSMVDFLRSQVSFDSQGRIIIPEKRGGGGGPVSLGGKSKRTRSGRQLDSSDLEQALNSQ